jgi:molybdopterin-binding protein
MPIDFNAIFPGATNEAQCTQSTQGKIIDVTNGATTSHVRIEIAAGMVITASITNEAVVDLALQKGDAAWAVMIGK